MRSPRRTLAVLVTGLLLIGGAPAARAAAPDPVVSEGPVSVTTGEDGVRVDAPGVNVVSGPDRVEVEVGRTPVSHVLVCADGTRVVVHSGRAPDCPPQEPRPEPPAPEPPAPEPPAPEPPSPGEPPAEESPDVPEPRPRLPRTPEDPRARPVPPQETPALGTDPAASPSPDAAAPASPTEEPPAAARREEPVAEAAALPMADMTGGGSTVSPTFGTMRTSAVLVVIVAVAASASAGAAARANRQ
ncbi:hypothetical protein [Nocardiopsis sp. CC223A]|uniref:hypothetical protein n=1 Tax=Nocardiopsis sp. CC223A TaxID=3044051 RepID=UPI00278BC16E|nr:hypothetical protein [Nocardiopsis sp. CC223A]